MTSESLIYFQTSLRDKLHQLDGSTTDIADKELINNAQQALETIEKCLNESLNSTKFLCEIDHGVKLRRTNRIQKSMSIDCKNRSVLGSKL